jgi:haloalkane dehalogenase
MRLATKDVLGGQSPEAVYGSAPMQRLEVEDATIALRVFGQGPAVVLVHGFPVHGYTWHKLLPKLSETLTCYVVDLPGLGDSDWSERTDFTFTAQAHRLKILFESLHLNSCALIAHDTGATIARLLTLLHPQAVRKLVIINTEIPGHRPPWIPLYQHVATLVLAHLVPFLA